MVLPTTYEGLTWTGLNYKEESQGLLRSQIPSKAEIVGVIYSFMFFMKGVIF